MKSFLLYFDGSVKGYIAGLGVSIQTLGGEEIYNFTQSITLTKKGDTVTAELAALYYGLCKLSAVENPNKTILHIKTDNQAIERCLSDSSRDMFSADIHTLFVENIQSEILSFEYTNCTIVPNRQCNTDANLLANTARKEH